MPKPLALRFGELLRRLRRTRSGNVALLVALSAVPLVLAFGVGVDYTLGTQKQDALNGIADAATLAAVTPAAIGQSTDAAKAIATNVFRTQAAQVNGVTITAVSVSVSKTTTSGVVQTATVTYQAQAQTLFANLLGISGIALSGHSTSTASTPYFVNIYVVVDISQSMGIAATTADMAALYARTSQYNGPQNGCVFGCHVAQGTGATYANNYLAHAITPTITLRVDSAVSAIETILNTANGIANASKFLQFAIYTMSEDPVTGNLVNPVAPLSNNFAAVGAQASAITLGDNTSAGIGDTDFADQLPAFAALIPAQGTGLTADSPLNYVFIVTDGASDVHGACPDGHCTAAFDPTLCQTLQANATVGVIYTTYLPIYTNNDPSLGLDVRYSTLIAPFASQIASNLQSCASSPSTFYQASDGPGLVSSMNSLFATALGAAHLTQ